MNNRTIIFAIALAVLASCQEKWAPENAGTGNNIRFCATKTATKTVYDDENDLQINWVAGDQVKIYCAEAEDVKEATYKVTRKETLGQKHKGHLQLATEINKDGLKWGGDTDEHNFFAVYPANTTITVEDGIATCKVNTNQICTVRNSSDDHIVADPDMTNAYMVADLSTQPVDSVNLHFRPIMTTLKIKIQAKTDGNQTDAMVTGVSIISKTKCFTDKFSYDIENSQIIYDENAVTESVTTMVTVKNGSNNFVDLATGRTLTLTAFIPPVDVDADNPIQIQLHCQHTDVLKTTLGIKAGTQIAASSKRKITLPNVPNTVQKGNNWITPLDDNIYVSQLSIPGTHDAATGDGTPFSLGKTQEMKLDAQFEMGIRAFDLRPAVSSGNIILCHGAVATSFNWDQVMERFKFYLSENPGEFIIVALRHEDEYDNNSSQWGGLMQGKLETIKATTNPATGESYTIDFRPDLTVGEMRGKVLFLCRDWTAYNSNGPVVGGYMGWSHDKEGAEVPIYGPDSNSRGTLNIQDCYHYSDAGLNLLNYRKFPERKWEAIEKQLNISATFHTNPELVNRWCINHTSGYTDNLISTTNGYRNNAANNHIKFYNKITSPDWVGSTGIILSDFVGARTSGNYTVYGDLLPQAIIDNNYKYHMVRKQ
ncbi:MAG: fimbrillin family protein [Bacteroidales bacterium]|nr:fimbrillin family protein [Bacteroidales bacterium]